VSSKVSEYWPITAPPCAESRISMVHAFEEPVAGTVGVNVMSSVSEVPRLPKYSTDSGMALPVPPASVAVAGRLMPRFIAVVGSPAVWLALMTTG
jgi:hypothetical protein